MSTYLHTDRLVPIKRICYGVKIRTDKCLHIVSDNSGGCAPLLDKTMFLSYSKSFAYIIYVKRY